MADEGLEAANAAGAEEAVPVVVVSSRIKELVKAKGLRSDGHLMEALSRKVIELLDRATEHAKEEGRMTVRPADVLAA